MSSGLTPCVKGNGYGHHWLIDTPDGNVWNEALCKLCGKHRLFKASWPRSPDWDVVREARLEEETKRRRRKWK
jgi:hypothetical protein